MRVRSAAATVLALWAGSSYGQSPSVPTLSVDAAASRVAISPDIYGIVSYGLDAAFAKEVQVGNVRWGGDATSRYNWEVDSSNAGFDFYFIGGSGASTAPTPGASPDSMFSTYKPAHANALITIPILPYINKSYAWSCSFPVSVYGAQTATNPYVFPVVNGVTETCGNSIATVATNGTTQLTDTAILANHIANAPSIQQAWVQHLVGTFGTAASGGVKYYQLDNEPLGWSNTHRDVQPTTATYATIAQLGQEYAAAVKQADSSALVLGPSDFTLGGWVGTQSQQGGLWAGQYYLQKMAAYEQTNHLRLLDYFDEHYYFDTSTPAAQLASTRTLWDPTYNGGTWVEQYDFDGPMKLIPRFKDWINTYYPGTKLSLSEYSIDSGQKSIVDALAEMDVLGIYGREQLDLANMWTPPAPTDPIAYSFRMFRNYDGNGHQFGDTSISAASSDQGSLSVYAAQRTTDNAVTILAINKTTSAISSTISLANLNLPAMALVFSYSATNLNAIVPAADATITGGILAYTFPGYSAVLFVVQPALLSTTTSLSAGASQLTVGSAATFTATVTASSSTPSGSVLLSDGSVSLGTLSLSNGVASLAVTSLAVGTHNITAAYAGNSMDAPSSSSVTVIVTAASAPPTSGVGDYALSLASVALTAGATRSAVTTVTVSPENGFSAALSFTCSGLPAGWMCNFAPSTLSGPTTETTTLTVLAASTGLNQSPASGMLLAIVAPWQLLLIGVGTAKLGARRAVSLALAVALLASCGGDSGSGTSSTPAPPSSTYTVSVTASGSSVPTHSQTFSLTIDGP